MNAVDRAVVAAYFAAGDAASTAHAKGAALEELIVYLFGLIPGLDCCGRDAQNAAGAAEIDVAFWNDGLPEGLRTFDHIILVECKNTSERVTWEQVTVFDAKLVSRGRPFGVLIAANGITGTAADRRRAHSAVATALAAGREIVVLTRVEIEALADTDELVTLLKRKRVELAVSGTIHGV